MTSIRSEHPDILTDDELERFYRALLTTSPVTDSRSGIRESAEITGIPEGRIRHYSTVTLIESFERHNRPVPSYLVRSLRDHEQGTA